MSTLSWSDAESKHTWQYSSSSWRLDAPLAQRARPGASADVEPRYQFAIHLERQGEPEAPTATPAQLKPPAANTTMVESTAWLSLSYDDVARMAAAVDEGLAALNSAQYRRLNRLIA